MDDPVLAFAAIAASLAAPASAARPQVMDVKLIAQTDSPRPGQTILVGLRMTPRPGWHRFWSNPGPSGLAPVVKWRAPRGVRFGPLQHPAPTLMQVMGMASYVHDGPHVLIARMKIRAGLKVGTALPVVADVTWAACSDRLCVPGKVRLSLLFKVGGGELSAEAPVLRRALAGEPKRCAGGSVIVRGREIVLRLPGGAGLHGRAAQFFPDWNSYRDPLRQRVLRGRQLAISSPAIGPVPRRITGVVSDGSAACRLAFERQSGRR